MSFIDLARIEIYKNSFSLQGNCSNYIFLFSSDSGGPPVQPNPTQGKLQMFVYEQFENLFHILAQFCSSLSHQFYKQPGLASALVTSVFQGIDSVPDYRMRSVVRLFLKSLINKCPKSCFGTVLAPVLSQFCPYMLERLNKTWEQLKLARESPTFDENNTDSQEVIDDFYGRQISREWIDVLKAILTRSVFLSITVTAPLKAAADNQKIFFSPEDASFESGLY